MMFLRRLILRYRHHRGISRAPANMGMRAAKFFQRSKNGGDE